MGAFSDFTSTLEVMVDDNITYSTLILALECIGLRNQELSKLQKCGVSWYLKLLYYVQMCFHILQVHWLLLCIVLSCGGNNNYIHWM